MKENPINDQPEIVQPPHEPGKTLIRDVIGKSVIAYIDSSKEILYMNEKDFELVLTTLKTTIVDGHVLISRGKPLLGQGFVLNCRIQPMNTIPSRDTVDLRDGKVEREGICHLFSPGTCISVGWDGEVKYYIKAPWYGIAVCINEPGTCETWFSRDNVSVHQIVGCIDPGKIKPVFLWVCSPI